MDFGIFRKKCQISEGRLPPEDVSVWLENLWTCFSDDIAIIVPGFFWMRGDFSKKSQISEGRLPPEDVSVWLENLWTCFSDDIAQILPQDFFG